MKELLIVLSSVFCLHDLDDGASQTDWPADAEPTEPGKTETLLFAETVNFEFIACGGLAADDLKRPASLCHHG